MGNFISEMRRRNVFRVMAAYLVIGWLLLQVADTVVPALHLPEWIISALTLLLILGFVPMVLFSWVYELTPDGLKRDVALKNNQVTQSQTAKKLDIITLLAVAGVLALAGYQHFTADNKNRVDPIQNQALNPTIENTSSEKSIAVLPFADMSVEGDQAYFADGISEELLNVLAQVDGLKVAARTSSFKFRGDEHDIGEIGNALNVKTVLEGSVRKAGNQVRITAQLIDVSGGFHVWSETYDRELDNIFAVQDEIASSIVAALKLKLQLHELVGDAKQNESGQAYDLYLRGREQAREPSKEGLSKAIQFFEQALVIEPDFAAAHGAIASAWIWLEDYGGIPSQDAFDQAEPAARRALELEPDRADALTAIGFLEERKYSNVKAARNYFEQAIKANPAFIEAYTLYADALVDLGEIDLALEIRRESVERDPLSSFLQSRLASMMVSLRRFDEAQNIIDDILHQNPNDTYAYEELANLYVRQGRLADAIPVYEFVHQNRPGDPFAAAQIAVCYHLMQMPEKQQFWIDQARDRGAGNRWELSALRSVAQWSGDWDTVFRVGQLYLAKSGTTWQGQASLGKGDWEAARASFKRTLSSLNFRQGDAANGNVMEALTGLALAEKRLSIASWEVHFNSAKSFAENNLNIINLGTWPNINLNYTMAQLAAIEGDVDAVENHMQRALDENILEYTFIHYDPFFSDLRDEPRLLSIAQQMKDRAQAEAEKLELAP